MGPLSGEHHLRNGAELHTAFLDLTSPLAQPRDLILCLPYTCGTSSQPADPWLAPDTDSWASEVLASWTWRERRLWLSEDLRPVCWKGLDHAALLSP